MRPAKLLVWRGLLRSDMRYEEKGEESTLLKANLIRMAEYRMKNNNSGGSPFRNSMGLSTDEMTMGISRKLLIQQG